MYPILIEFKKIWSELPNLHTYGLMIATAFLVGMQLAVREAKRVDLGPEKTFDVFVLDLCFWILIVSMIGSRILFIFVNWENDYSKNPGKIFKIWEGGLVFYGGLLSSVAFSVYYSIRKKRDFFQVADMLIPSVALGQFFGRLGCFAAGCCWGKVVDDSFPLGVQFPSGSLAFGSMQRAHQTVEVAGQLYTQHIHPVQIYESTGDLVLFFLLLLVRGHKRFHGHVFLVYLFLYPILRVSTEFLRGDIERGQYDLFGVRLSPGQIISILVALSAVTLLVFFWRRFSAKAPAAAAGAPAL